MLANVIILSLRCENPQSQINVIKTAMQDFFFKKKRVSTHSADLIYFTILSVFLDLKLGSVVTSLYLYLTLVFSYFGISHHHCLDCQNGDTDVPHFSFKLTAGRTEVTTFGCFLQPTSISCWSVHDDCLQSVGLENEVHR